MTLNQGIGPYRVQDLHGIIAYHIIQQVKKVLGRRPFVVLREKHEIGICYQIGTVDTFKAPSIPVTNLGLI